jgi:hypothetical protein
MTPKATKHDIELAEKLATFYADPLGFVMFCFPFDTDKSIQLAKLDDAYKHRFPGAVFGPDVWACQFLDRIAKEVSERGFDGERAVDPIKFSTASGHGIGKSTLTAWIILWLMATRPNAKGTVTAGTDTQLRTKTWAEVGKWFAMSPFQHWFNYTTGRGAMSLSSRKSPTRWLCTAQTCREENSESFAGQHAADSTSFYIFDEASQIPDKIYDVREGGLTDGEPHVYDFGNPTRNTGRFFENTTGKFKHRYIVQQIDSRDVQITNKKLMQQWIADNGIESDFVKVRIRGLFPSMGSGQFIPMANVVSAMTRDLPPESDYAPLLIGVDVARFGDDESVIYARLGDDARRFAPERYRGLDTMELADRIVALIKRFAALGKKPSGVFIDATGVGVGVVDRMRQLGYEVIEVHFGSKPQDGITYRFKGDECWGRMRDALKTRLAIPTDYEPNGTVLKEQLTQRLFDYTLVGNKISLEPKKDMKERLGSEDGASPNIADALALTYAQEVAIELLGSRDTSEARSYTHEQDPVWG